MIEYNVNTTPTDEDIAQIESDAIEFKADFDTYNDAYNYFYNAYVNSCYQSFESGAQ